MFCFGFFCFLRCSAFDMSLQQYAAATVKAILRLSGVKLRKEISAGQQEGQAEPPAFSVPTRAVLAQFDEYLDEWDLLIKKFRDSEQDQSELIMGVEDLCSEDQSFLKPYFRFILQLLYQNDILDSDGILEWHRVRQIDSQNGDAGQSTDTCLPVRCPRLFFPPV